MERKEMTTFGSEKKEGYPNPNPNRVKHRKEKGTEKKTLTLTHDEEGKKMIRYK